MPPRFLHVYPAALPGRALELSHVLACGEQVCKGLDAKLCQFCSHKNLRVRIIFMCCFVFHAVLGSEDFPASYTCRSMSIRSHKKLW